MNPAADEPDLSHQNKSWDRTECQNKRRNQTNLIPYTGDTKGAKRVTNHLIIKQERAGKAEVSISVIET